MRELPKTINSADYKRMYLGCGATPELVYQHSQTSASASLALNATDGYPQREARLNALLFIHGPHAAKWHFVSVLRQP